MASAARFLIAKEQFSALFYVAAECVIECASIDAICVASNVFISGGRMLA
jgi:hypothetical protein